MEWHVPASSVSQFGDLLKDASGVDINVCYQCRKCASGCPVADAMDYSPVQLLHAARLGLKDLVLGSATIWLCASCETCVTRCPQDVDLVRVMDSLRAMALQVGVRPRVPEVAHFYRSALENVGLFGRMYDLGLIARWKLATRQISRGDLRLGLQMFRKGKLKILPDLAGFGRTRKLFARVRKLERR